MAKEHQTVRKCAKTGHLIRECQSPKEARDHTSLGNTRNTQMDSRWITRQRIPQMEVEQDNEAEAESRKDRDFQQKMVGGVNQKENPSLYAAFM